MMGNLQTSVSPAAEELRSTNGINAYFSAGFVFSFKADNPVNLGKESIVFTHPYILPWMKLRAHLSHQDVSGPDRLAAKAFYTAPLGRTVTTVS